jgi:hypothetical protein
VKKGRESFPETNDGAILGNGKDFTIAPEARRPTREAIIARQLLGGATEIVVDQKGRAASANVMNLARFKLASAAPTREMRNERSHQ